MIKRPVCNNKMESIEDNNKLEELFERLGRSGFRSRFRLGDSERAYLEAKGVDVIEQHARQFITERLGPAVIANDGKQTPMRNHPVFIAQHATATCCRKCIAKWHNIKQGKMLEDHEINFIVDLLMAWLQTEARRSDI